MVCIKCILTFIVRYVIISLQGAVEPLEKGVIPMEVNFSDLIQLGLLIVATISLILQMKKK